MGTKSTSSPNTEDKEAKRKQSELRYPNDGELPPLKRSRQTVDSAVHDFSDEDRERRFRRGHERDGGRRARKKDEYSPSPERKYRDRNGSRRDSEKHRESRRESKKDMYYAPSPDRKDRVGDVSDGHSPLKHRDKGRYKGDKVSNKEDYVSLPKHGGDSGRRESPLQRDERRYGKEKVSNRNRDYSSSPDRDKRDNPSPPPRNGGQQEPHFPSNHRDTSRYDRVSDKKERLLNVRVASQGAGSFGRDDGVFDKKERLLSGQDNRGASQDARTSGRDDKVSERHDKFYDRNNNTDVQVHNRERDGFDSDRMAVERDPKLRARESVLDRYVGDGDVRLCEKDDALRQKHEQASNPEKKNRNEEEYDSAEEQRRRGKSRGNDDDKDRHRSLRRSHESDRKSRQKRCVDMVDEDELAIKKKRDNVEPKHVDRHSRSKASTRETEARAAGKENKVSNSNIPAANSGTELPQGRSGGVYIPPFKLAQMMKEVQDKSGVEYQRMTWDALRKSINGLVNKVNASNIKNIIPELLAENLIRGRGLFARSCMKSQMASPLFTHVFAALVAVVNTKFPELGELLLKRVILQFRRALKRNDKPLLLAAARFIAHLVNQQVAHEVVALEVLMVLLENPTDDSVEVSVGFVKECGAILQDLAPQGLHGIFERFRGILHEGEIDKRVQFMIEGLFAIRKSNFQGHPAVVPELDLVDQEDQFTHEISLSEDLDAEMSLDIFKSDENFLENEKKYEDIKRDILGEESSDDDDGEKGSGVSSEEDEDDEDEEEEMQRMQIKDETETNLVNLRRTIYLTIMSSVDFEEAGHKLLKIKLEPGQEMELNIMLLECCSQERTYLRYYGLLGQRFCMINKIYQDNFDECFVKQYSMIHRLETNKLRNVAKFFAHLLGTDALSWNVLAYIRLTEEDTTSSSRIFIKILFQELSEHLGLRKLNEKLSDPNMQESFDGIFPKDNPKNTRFAINFFTSIGLGGITDNLREYLKNMPRLIMQQQRQLESESDSSDSGDPSGAESSSSESDSETSSSESESESESESDSDRDSRRKRKRK